MKSKIKLRDPMVDKKDMKTDLVPFRPCIYFSDEQLPEIKKVEVGNEVVLKVICRAQVS